MLYAGASRAEVAKRCGVHRKTVAAWAIEASSDDAIRRELAQVGAAVAWLIRVATC
jgi:transposase